MSIGTWNIHGLYNNVLGDKTKNKDFIDIISKVDFMVLTETWSNCNIDLPGFETIFAELAKPLHKNACRQSGGINILFKNKYKNYTTTIKNSKNFLWIKISKTILNSNKDLYICGTYIPPEKSNYFDPEIFEEIEQDIITFSTRGNIIILGDLNARTGKINECLSDDGHTHIQDQSEHSLQTKGRESFDLTINNHGKHLINICKSYDLKILNGRTRGDSLGRPTFHGKNGTSVIDYIICSQELLPSVKHLAVHPPTYLSDHSPVTSWINLCDIIENNNNNEAEINLQKLHTKYMWEEDSKSKFVEQIQTDEVKQKLNTFLNRDYSNNKNDIQTCVNEFQDILLHATKKCLKMKKKKYRRVSENIANKKWFDKECRIQRHNLRKIANKKHLNPNNIEVRNNYQTALKEYKNMLKSKKDQFEQNKIDELANATSDPKQFWKILSNTTDDIDNNTKRMPPPNEWLTHFEQLHSQHQLYQEQNEIITHLKDL